jgi:hypothetical protein
MTDSVQKWNVVNTYAYDLNWLRNDVNLLRPGIIYDVIHCHNAFCRMEILVWQGASAATDSA